MINDHRVEYPRLLICQLEVDIQFVTKYNAHWRGYIQYTMPLRMPKFIHDENAYKSSFTWSIIYTMDRVRLSSIW